MLTARHTGTGDPGVRVLPFDATHHRVLLGPHRHGNLELMFYAEGSGVDRLGDVAFDVAAGDVLLVTPGVVHDASGIAGARGWAIEFDAASVITVDATASNRARTTGRLWWSNPLLTPFVRAGRGPRHAHLRVPPDRHDEWVARMREMEREHAERIDGWEEVLSALLHVTLIDLARFAAPHAAGLRHQGETVLAQVFELIDARYAEPLSTSDVAAAVALTPTYLTTLVRQRTGRTVLDWIHERRMAAARELLLETDLTVEAVAAQVGYTDPTYFSRRFRAHHGLAPGRWRTAAGI
ncbi:AraC family transcriptional regulator [Sporichthya brevicatena]|uniref:AraC family transcriptional regulator n=1 Tax=Sporichthya brevicatena TaxID=171442 RepID=A0ABN1H8B5_9ACTN